LGNPSILNVTRIEFAHPADSDRVADCDLAVGVVVRHQQQRPRTHTFAAPALHAFAHGGDAGFSAKRDSAGRLRPGLLSLLLGLDAAAQLDIDALAVRTPPTRSPRWHQSEASRLRRHPPLNENAGVRDRGLSVA
jgi:hypothetical protein